MKFGGLSEAEVGNISTILETEKILFAISKDEEIEAFNATSMKNNLRHYAPPNLSTHMLAITIADEDFAKLSDSSKTQLLEFGITDQAPSPEDFYPQGPESIHKQLAEGPKRLVAYNFKHQLILMALGLLIFWGIKTFWSAK